MPSGEERLIELVNLAVDGAATPEQEGELGALLEGSPAARELLAATRAVAARLEALPPAEPPAALRREVLDRIHMGKVVPSGRLRARRRRFAFAWAAAAALIAAYLILQPPQIARRDARAVMAPPAAHGAVVATFRSAAGARTAELIVRRTGEVYTFEPVISGPRPVWGRLAWDPAGAVLTGISGPADASSEYNAAFTFRDGADRVSVALRRAGGRPLEVRLSVGGEEVLQARLPAD